MGRERLLSSRMITTFGLGHVRPASGTWGSMPPVAWAAGLVLVAGLTTLDSVVWWLWHTSLWVTLLGFSWAVIAGGDRAEGVFGQDPSEVVADETAGQCIPLLAIPPAFIAGGWWEALLGLGLAFVFFRAFDILKVFPSNVLQRVPGAWGILLDDLVAGVYAAGCLWLVSLAV